jgi:archaellum component FlaC
MKKLVGRTDVEDALLRLDMLTKEETLMAVVRNLEVTHHVGGVVHDVDSNVKATKALTEDIDDNVKATKLHIHDVDSNIKATKVLIEDIDDNVKGVEVVARSVDNNLKVTKNGA